jgi:hypothetical protein
LADRLVACRLRRDPQLLQTARGNLRRWISRERNNVPSVFVEWAEILDGLTRAEIARFLESDSPKARRLRQSTPFMGLLNEREKRRLADL